MSEQTSHMLTPESYTQPPSPPPKGNFLTRGIEAIRERRMPYQARQQLDKVLVSIGVKYRSVKVGGALIRTRRCTVDENVAQHILSEEEYNADGYEIGDSDTVIDVGGQIGCFAVYAALRATKGKVFTFEPMSENYQLLTHNVNLNHLGNVVTSRSAVVGGQERTVRLFVTDFTGGHSVKPEYADSLDEYEDVPGMSLEAIFKKNSMQKCDFLKLDCEGAEFDILLNTPDSVLNRVERIAMEWHASSMDSKLAESQQLVKRLIDLGFTIDKYVEFSLFKCGLIFAKRS